MPPPCWVYTVLTLSRPAGKLLPHEPHLQVQFCPLFIPKPLGNPRLRLSSSLPQRQKPDCGEVGDAMLFPDHPNHPCSCPKAPARALCQSITGCTAFWKTRKTSREECGRILLPLQRHLEPSVEVVSAFLFPESAKPAEAAKWETWGTLN